jgi:hypothetical protein
LIASTNTQPIEAKNVKKRKTPRASPEINLFISGKLLTNRSNHASQAPRIAQRTPTTS